MKKNVMREWNDSTISLLRAIEHTKNLFKYGFDNPALASRLESALVHQGEALRNLSEAVHIMEAKSSKLPTTEVVGFP